MPSTIIIGGGIIGLCTAFSLKQRGVDVTILDAGPPEKASSHANAGWVTMSLAGPVPAPGLVATSMRWMLKPDSPLYVKPRLNPGFIRWLLAFWRHCNPLAYAAGTTAIGEFGRNTLELYDELSAAGVRFEEHKTGLIFAYRDPAALERDHLALQALEPFGYTGIDLLDGKAVHELEPGLVSGLAGGYWAKQERHVRPDDLVNGLRDWLTRAGVEFRCGVTVTGFDTQRGRVRSLQTSAGLMPVETVIACAGAWSGPLLRQASLRVPVEMGKGYSLDFVPSPQSTPVTHALYLHEERVAITPLDGRLRLAGTMELSGLHHTINPRRVEAISRAGATYLRGWSATAKPHSVWTGGRPMTPDGLPIIGLAPGYQNLAIATGHAMLGVTLGPSTGEAVAELITTGTPPATIAPFRAERFA